MCSSAGDIEDITNCTKEIRNVNKDFLQKCKKCGEKSLVLLQKKDPFCKQCFFEYCNHKFRSTIGKSKKIKHGEKVLLSCSGGRKSAALLHMTKQTLKSASLKQISFSPAILFIDDSFIISNITGNAEPDIHCLLKELKSYGYTVLYSSLEMVYRINAKEVLYSLVSDDFSTDSFSACQELKIKMTETFKEISMSSKIDLLKHFRLLLTTEIAKQAGCDCVFVGDTASLLAVELLSDIALGRGSQIFSDTGFYDTRYKVPVCRPLREFLNKEIALYNHLHNVSYRIFPDFLTKTTSNSSIQRLTETFLSNLQENFPATVFTVFRTGSKLSKSNICLDEKCCIVCKSQLDNVNPDPCSALEALKISQKLSAGCSHEPIENDSAMELVQFFCHACSNTLKCLSRRQDFYRLIPGEVVKMERHKIKEEIKEFLLEENNDS